MKAILIIEHDVVELEALMDICRLDSREFLILSARDEESARMILDEKHIDLIVCSTTFPNTHDCRVLDGIARLYPYIPIIAVAPKNSVAEDSVRSLGASALYEKPFEDERLLEQVNELIEFSSTGTVRGIPIHSFLQMLESEGKTCTLHVFGNNTTGLIFIKDGVPINADTGSLSGEEAIYEIISWNEVIIDIRFFNGLRKNSISKPLISLIMEGFRLKDEREVKKKEEQTIEQPKHQLKQVSTAGHRLALDIGLRMKIEFDTIDSNLDSTFVGMAPDNCVIITTPSHFIITKTTVEVGRLAVVKYMHMGKLCLFKSRILSVINSPLPMLFLDYPTIIHYHEMRRATRTSVYIPCNINVPDGTKYFGAFNNLSSVGGLCRVKTKGNRSIPDIKIGQRIGLSCLFPGLTEEQHIQGIVRNLKQDSLETCISIEFVELHTYLKETIERYLLSVEISTNQPVRLSKLPNYE